MTPAHSLHQKICDDLTLVQLDLDAMLQELLTQAGNKLQTEKQEELKQNVENTKQRLERFKSQYVCTP